MFQIVVIGGGPVGIFCCFMLGVFGFKKICIVEASEMLGGKCAHLFPEKNVYDVAGLPRIKGAELVQNLQEQLELFRPEVMLETQVSKIIRREGGFILSTNRGEIEASKVIICCGKGTINPRKPKIPGFQEAEAAGAMRYSLKELELFRGKDVVVGGGGDSALDWCFELQDIAKSITLVHRSALRAAKSSQERLLQMAEAGECRLLMPVELDAIECGENNWTLSVRSGEEIDKLPFDYFIPCYGSEVDRRSAAALVEDLDVELSEEGIILTKDFRTTEPGLYYVPAASWLTVGFSMALQAAQIASKDVYGEQDIPHSSSNPIFGGC